MAVILPIVLSWPNFEPDFKVDPGLPNFDAHVKALAESQNYLVGHYGKGLIAQCWPGRLGATNPTDLMTEPTLNPGRVESTSGGWDAVLRYTIHPRGAMGISVSFTARLASDNGGWMRVSCVEDGSVQTSAAFAAGIVFWHPGSATPGVLTFVAPRPDTLSTIQIELMRDAGGTYIDLLALQLHDTDLTAGTLP